MVLKQVTPLYELSLKVVSDDISKFVKEHCGPCEFCSVCKTDQCSVITPVMEMLDLPENIIQSVYDKVYPELGLSVVLKSQRHGHVLCMVGPYTNMLYLLFSVLKVEHTSVKIKNFWFKRNDEDMPFILKFGKNINSLEFEGKKNSDFTLDDFPQNIREHPIIQQCVRRCKSNSSNPYDISASIFSLILQSANNIQELKFHPEIKVSDDLLEVVGRECTQLKVLNNITVGDEYATAQSFDKLLFHSNKTGIHRNKCCDTLQAVNINYCKFVTERYSKMNEILNLLVQNIPHLKSFGEYVSLAYYLETLKDNEIHETALDYIYFCELRKQTATRLKVFSPTVKKLKVMCLQSEVVESLSALKCLEEVTLEADSVVISEIFTTQWCYLKVLSVSFRNKEEFIDVDIDLIAKNLPVLTNLSIDISCASWRGNTYFNCLEKLSLQVLDTNISWFESFASTVKSVDIDSCGVALSPDSCKVFLTVPFPNLKYLYITDFPYNFQFHSNVLAELPKLETCIIYDHETLPEREQHLEQLSQFLKINNLQCELGGADPESNSQ